ncbi:MAG: Lrp/AsnC family transcriptional regulator [Rhodomicrobium sp.]
MDDTDRKLIHLLCGNARLPVASLAAILGVSRATVQKRLDRLIEAGTISSFTITTNAEAEPGAVRAVMMIEIEGERSETVLRALRRFHEVVAVHTTNGRWDLVVELKTDGLDTFDKALRSIREMKGIASSETSLLLSTHTDRKGDRHRT